MPFLLIILYTDIMYVQIWLLVLDYYCTSTTVSVTNSVETWTRIGTGCKQKVGQTTRTLTRPYSCQQGEFTPAISCPQGEFTPPYQQGEFTPPYSYQQGEFTPAYSYQNEQGDGVVRCSQSSSSPHIQPY